MNYNSKVDLRPGRRTAATLLPPALIEETAWDILLALHSDERCELSLDKLASIVSAPPPALHHRLALLEERRLITGTKYGGVQEIRAILTAAGRELLDRYLSAASSLQVGVHL